MIDPAIFHRIQNSVCAVGYVVSPLAQWLRNAGTAGQYRVVGTGFLVRSDIVLTNRHVIDDLERETKANSIPESQHVLRFVAPRPDGHVSVVACEVLDRHTLRDDNLDVGFIKFRRTQPELFANILPVEIGDPFDVRVSEEIAALGYPHGNALEQKRGQVSRWGAILQQGWISGISPWEALGSPNEFLLDLRAAPGISGAPVFRPSTGKVLGVLHTGTGIEDGPTTTAFAQPIFADLLDEWLVEFYTERQSFDHP